MSVDTGVIVRRNARHDVVLPAAVRVDPADEGIFRLGSRAGAKDGWVSADLMDLGSGGAGLIAPAFFPRALRVTLRVFALGGEPGVPLLEVPGTVMRVTQTDRRPAYLIGLAFTRLSDEERRRVEALVDRLDESGS